MQSLQRWKVLPDCDGVTVKKPCSGLSIMISWGVNIIYINDLHKFVSHALEYARMGITVSDMFDGFSSATLVCSDGLADERTFKGSEGIPANWRAILFKYTMQEKQVYRNNARGIYTNWV